MADVGALGVDAARCRTLSPPDLRPAREAPPTTSALAPPPPRGVPAENGEDGRTADATPDSAPGPPRQADDEPPVPSAERARRAARATSVAEPAVSAAYAEPLAQAVELARARWLLAAAAAAAAEGAGGGRRDGRGVVRRAGS